MSIIDEINNQKEDIQNERSSPSIPSIDISIIMGVTYALMKEYTTDIIPTWHSAAHIRSRENIRKHISQLILQRRPNSTSDWHEKLIEVSHKVEERLYYMASCFEEYLDLDTLLERIVMVVNSTISEGRNIIESEPSIEDSASEEEEDQVIKQLVKDNTEKVPLKKPITSRQVSSQGCSRVFIVKVLASVSEFVSGKLLPSIFTFPRELVVGWLQKAKESCCSSSLLAEEEYYGGPPFVADDPSTHWTEPHQLYTWWKNNVERKVKYKVLQEDATYGGPDQRRAARARWCAVIVSLAEVIRCSSGSSLQSKSLASALNTIHPDPTKDNCILTPEPQYGIFPYGLPSFQYPMGTNIPNNQFSRIRSGFKNIGLNSFVSRGIGDIGQNSIIKSIIPNSENRSSEMDDTNIPTQLPSVPQLLLSDRHNLTSSSSNPNGYFVRQLPSWNSNNINSINNNSSINNNNEIDISKIIQGQIPKLSSTWKDRWTGGDESTLEDNIKKSLPSKELKSPSSLTSTSSIISNYQQLPPPPPSLPTTSNMTSTSSPSTSSSLLLPANYVIHHPSKGFQQAFPLKLFDLVTEQNNDIIGWLPEGNAFKVKHMENFVGVILPAYFKHANFTSFQRQLNLYGFRRTKESEKGAYYHAHFLAGRRDLAAGIRRVLSHNNHNSNGNNNNQQHHSDIGNIQNNGNIGLNIMNINGVSNFNSSGNNNNNLNNNKGNNNKDKDNKDNDDVDNKNKDNNSDNKDDNNKDNNNDNNNNNANNANNSSDNNSGNKNDNSTGNNERPRQYTGEFNSLHGPRRNSAKHKTQKSIEKTPKDTSTSKSSKETIVHSLLTNVEPLHEYSTRRKKLKKENNEFSSTDDQKGNENNNNDDDYEEGEYEDQSGYETGIISNSDVALPLVYVSGLNSSQDCDEVIDMTTIPNQRRRLTTRRILIDMTPILNGRSAIVSETQTEYPLSKKRQHSILNKSSKDDSNNNNNNNNSFYSNTLSNISHSKYTRVGDEFQAIIPKLLTKEQQHFEKNESVYYPKLNDELYRLSRLEVRKKEQKFLQFSSSQVITAVIPNSTTRKSRNISSSPPCILSDIYNRTRLLESQFISPPECFMSVELKNSLFPRLCVTLRTFKLIQREKTISDERPVLYFVSLDENGGDDNDGNDNNNRFIESPLWGCEYLIDDDSDSDVEWKENDPRIKDFSSIIQNRYAEFDIHDTIFLEVTDGIQNWIVPWSVCAAAGSVDYEEYLLNQIKSDSDLNNIRNNNNNNNNNSKNSSMDVTKKFTLTELRKLASIDISMNEYLIQISPTLKRSDENISKAWKELQNSSNSNNWPLNLKDFVFFCHRYCPHPNDSSLSCDSRIIAMRRLINMTSDIDISPKLDELLINKKDKDIILKQHLKSLSNRNNKQDTESDEEDSPSDTDKFNSNNSNDNSNDINDNDSNLMEIQDSNRPTTRRSLNQSIQNHQNHNNKIEIDPHIQNESETNNTIIEPPLSPSSTSTSTPPIATTTTTTTTTSELVSSIKSPNTRRMATRGSIRRKSIV